MIELNEKNFSETISKSPKALVFFYRETGCPHCDKMKPVFEQLAEAADFGCFKYKLGPTPDSVATQELVPSFPTFAGYINGQLVNKKHGSMAIEKILEAFNPPIVPIKDMPLQQLHADEAALIDMIYPAKLKLEEIRAEIKRRREAV